jgi:hypothetical protein
MQSNNSCLALKHTQAINRRESVLHKAQPTRIHFVYEPCSADDTPRSVNIQSDFNLQLTQYCIKSDTDTIFGFSMIILGEMHPEIIFFVYAGEINAVLSASD